MAKFVKRGQAIGGNLDAGLINDLRAMRDEWKGQRISMSLDSLGFKQSQTEILCLNPSTTSSFQTFGPVTVRTIAFSSAAAAQESLARGDRHVAACYSPSLTNLSGALRSSTSNDSGKFGICQEPIPPGAVGRVVVAGVTPAWVYGRSTAFDTCDISHDNYFALKAGLRGSADIITQLFGASEFSTLADKELCLIRLNGPRRAPECFTFTGASIFLDTTWQISGGNSKGSIRNMERGPSTNFQVQSVEDLDQCFYIDGTFHSTPDTTPTFAKARARFAIRNSSGSLIANSVTAEWNPDECNTCGLSWAYKFGSASNGYYISAEVQASTTPSTPMNCTTSWRVTPTMDNMGDPAE